MKFWTSLSLIGLVLGSYLIKAQTAAKTSYTVDQQINDFMLQWHITGGEVAITKDGKTVYNKAFGYSDQAKKTPAKNDNLYRIASVSKPITSMGIMKLVEQEKLSLDEKVFGNILDQDYYTDAISDPRIYDITVKELLEHTAGWDRNVPVDGYDHSDPAFFPLHVTEELNEPNPVGDSTLVKFLLKKGLNNEPGTHYAYSNIGYLVLGKVIEKKSGMKYGEYIQKNILQPAGITNVELGKNLVKEKNEVEYCGNSTTSSCYGDGKRVPWQYGGFNVEAMNAHGGWIATAEALTTLMNAHVLSNATDAVMTQPGKVNPGYAKGWNVNSAGNRWHTGSMDGTASFICKTKDGYTWAFLFNSRADNSDAFWKAFDRLPWRCIEEMKIIS
ncbi:MAG: serine hydrolase domain-containing protein [Bacteroidia bacterium]